MPRENLILPVVDLAVGDTIRGVQNLAGAPLSKNFTIDSVPARAPSGTASPEGVVTGRIGAFYLQIDLVSDPNVVLLWAKITGTGNTGWFSIAGSG